MDPGNLFENFVRALKADQQRLDKLESSIARVLGCVCRRLTWHAQKIARTRLHLRSSQSPTAAAANRIHALGEGVAVNDRAADVAIEIAATGDGSVVVLPALPA